MTSHQVLTRLLKLDPAWTLEETWENGKRAWGDTDTLGMTPEEAAGERLSKLALNVCLMATAYGVPLPGAGPTRRTTPGPASPPLSMTCLFTIRTANVKPCSRIAADLDNLRIPMLREESLFSEFGFRASRRPSPVPLIRQRHLPPLDFSSYAKRYPG